MYNKIHLFRGTLIHDSKDLLYPELRDHFEMALGTLGGLGDLFQISYVSRKCWIYETE